MKRILSLMLSATMVFALLILSGCGEKKSVDESFLEDMAAGLSARWDLNEQMEDSDKGDKKEAWEQYIGAEYDKISKYKEEQFEDEELGKTAKEYIGLLEESKESLEYFGNDEKFATKNDEIYKERAVIIYKLCKDEKLKFDDKYSEEVGEFSDLGKLVLDARDILANTKFKKVKDEYGWKEYEAVVENTSDTDFDYFSYNINLNDKDGVTVENPYVNTENWKAGTKHKFTFSTDKNFKEIEILSCEWDY